jgi:hypothetical protein
MGGLIAKERSLPDNLYFVCFFVLLLASQLLFWCLHLSLASSQVLLRDFAAFNGVLLGFPDTDVGWVSRVSVRLTRFSRRCSMAGIPKLFWTSDPFSKMNCYPRPPMAKLPTLLYELEALHYYNNAISYKILIILSTRNAT